MIAGSWTEKSIPTSDFVIFRYSDFCKYLCFEADFMVDMSIFYSHIFINVLFTALWFFLL